MNTEVLNADHPVALQHAVDVLNHGGTLVFPTDTVYGLAALPTRTEYIERLYVIKGRNSHRAIALLLSGLQELDQVSAGISQTALQLARRFWPGPLTLITARHPSLPKILSPEPTIGLRVPDHPLALELLHLTGPLAVTSANLSGRESALSAQEALAQLDGRVHLVLDGGRSPGGVPSTVVDCTTQEPVILRAGPITEAEIHKVLLELS